MSVVRPSINLLHILVIAPILGYVGYRAFQGKQMKITRNMSIILMIVATMIIAYHSYILYTASGPAYLASMRRRK